MRNLVAASKLKPGQPRYHVVYLSVPTIQRILRENRIRWCPRSRLYQFTAIDKAANGKVERSLRTDEDEFCRRLTFTSPKEPRRLLRSWEHEYNHLRRHLALRGKTPHEALCEFPIHTPRAVPDST